MSARPSLLALTGVLALAIPLRGGESLDAFLKKIKDPDAKTRRAAWDAAGEQGAAALLPLADILAGSDRDAALAAAHAMARIAHASAAPEGGAAKSRKEVAAVLAGI